MRLDDLAHLAELREDQRALTYLQDLLQHLGQPRELTRPAIDRRVVTQELRRMIAYLLQLRERRQHQSAAPNAVRIPDRIGGFLDDGRVQRGLLPRQRAGYLHLQLRRQIGDHAPAGLQPPHAQSPAHRPPPPTPPPTPPRPP